MGDAPENGRIASAESLRNPHADVHRGPDHVLGHATTRWPDLPNVPPPIQEPSPPRYIWVAWGPRRTMPIVARYADVWNVPTYGLARWEESLPVAGGRCAHVGRDPSTIRRSHEAVLVLTPGRDLPGGGAGKGGTSLRRRRLGHGGRGCIGTPPHGGRPPSPSSVGQGDHHLRLLHLRPGRAPYTRTVHGTGDAGLLLTDRIGSPVGPRTSAAICGTLQSGTRRRPVGALTR